MLVRNEMTMDVSHFEVLSLPKSILYRNTNAVLAMTPAQSNIQAITLNRCYV